MGKGTLVAAGLYTKPQNLITLSEFQIRRGYVQFPKMVFTESDNL